MANNEKILVFFLTSLGVFRVDLLGSVVAFEFTPTIFFSIILNVYCAIFLFKRQKVKLPHIAYSLIPIVFGYFAFRSFPIPDFGLYSRIGLFFYVILSSISFLILFNSICIQRRKIIIKNFFRYTIYVYLFFSIGEMFFFLMGYNFRENLNEYINLYPQTIGYFLPRLNGGFIDPNVCGYFFSSLFLLSIIYDVPNGRVFRVFFGSVVLLTLSRSAIATFSIILIIRWVHQRVVNVDISKLTIKIRTLAFLIVSIIVLILLFPFILELIDSANILLGLKTRFVDKGSTDYHMNLMNFGWKIILRDWWSLFWGNGFMSGAYYSAEFFNGNKYANFHSEYITVIIELGIIGLLLEVLLIYFPLFYSIKSKIGKSYLGFILFYISIALENVFYQQYMFFYYWTFIFVLYSYVFSSNSEKTI